MPADAGIYSQIRPFTMEDPLSQSAKALQIAGAQQQLREGDRKFTLEDDISKALAASGGDLGKASQDLAMRGRGTAALTLRDKATTQTKADIENKLKIWEQAGAWSIGLDQAYKQALQKSGGDPAAAITEIQPIWQETRAKAKELGLNLPEQFDPQKNFAGISTAKNHVEYFKMLQPNVHMTDTGGSVTPTNTNPMAGPVGPVPGATPIPKTAAPAAPTELARLIAERDAMPQGDPRRAQYDKTIEGYKAGRGTEVNVSTEKKYGEHFGAEIAKADVGMRDTAIKAPELAKRANDVMDVLRSGKVMTGAGADIRLSLGKALNLAGGDDNETIANTEQLAVSLAQNTLDAIKASGLGSGSGFSNADRDFLEKAVGGKITLEERTLKRLATLSHRAAEKSAERWNSRVKEIPDSALSGTGVTRDQIQVPGLSTGPQASSNPREVTLPNGTIKTFPTPAAAKRFREEAGL